MRIRQIALVARDLDATLADLRAVFALGEPFADPGVGVFGLHNGVLPVGEQFLEVVSPTQEGTTAGRYLERRRGDGGYMVIFQTHDLPARRASLEAAGVRVAWEIALDDIATVHLHPRDTGGAIVSIDEARPWESWRWAGPGWPSRVNRSRVRGIAGVEIQTGDPDALRDRWADLFDLPGGGRPGALAVGTGEWVSFCEAADGRGEGLRSVALRTADAEACRSAARERGLVVESDGAIRVGGVRFELV